MDEMNADERRSEAHALATVLTNEEIQESDRRVVRRLLLLVHTILIWPSGVGLAWRFLSGASTCRWRTCRAGSGS